VFYKIHHLPDIAGVRRVGGFPNADAGDGDLIPVFFGEFGEMRDVGFARPAPSGPELYHVNLIGLEFSNGFALDPFGRM
jgi:hypothetical protein